MRTPILITAAVLTVLTACADDATTADTTTADTTTADTTTAETTSTTPTADVDANVVDPVAVVVGLDADEVAGLLWMREEEQLAHDVYTALGEEWGLQVFENIAASEATHIEATIDLLDRYGIDDPSAGNEPGTFTDPTIQQLYDDLVARGLPSVEDALAVGATIEELDIADLRARAEATDETAIDDVYARLERASRNHLRAFARQLDRLDVEYEPTVLDDYEEIVSSPVERGRDGH